MAQNLSNEADVDVLRKTLIDLEIIKGGPGSGHHGHAGRPGKVGGSAPSTSPKLSRLVPDDDQFEVLPSGMAVSEVRGLMDELADWSFEIENREVFDMSRKDVAHVAVNRATFNPNFGWNVLLKRTADGELVGVASYRPTTDGTKLYLDHLATKRAGHGVSLMMKLLSIAYERNMGVNGISTAGAYRFYKGLAEMAGVDLEQYVDDGDQALIELDVPADVLKQIADPIFSTAKAIDDVKEFIDFWMGEDLGIYFVNPHDVVKGGPGSGHFGHEGRPGKVGGSAPSDSTDTLIRSVVGQADGRILQPEDVEKDSVGRGWLTPDGRFAVLRGEIHDTTAQVALAEAGLEPDYYTLLGERLTSAIGGLEREGFVRLIFDEGSLNYEGPRSLTFEQARFIARLLDFRRPTKSVYIDFYMGEDRRRMRGQEARDALSNIVNQAYRLAGKSRFPDTLQKTLADLGLLKGGPGSGHFGHEGRPGKVGGSKPSTSEFSYHPGITPSTQGAVDTVAQRVEDKTGLDLGPFRVTGDVDEAVKETVRAVFELHPTLSSSYVLPIATKAREQYEESVAVMTMEKAEGSTKKNLLFINQESLWDYGARQEGFVTATIAHEFGHWAHKRVLNWAKVDFQGPPTSYVRSLLENGYKAEQIHKEYVADLFSSLVNDRHDIIGSSLRGGEMTDEAFEDMEVLRLAIEDAVASKQADNNIYLAFIPFVNGLYEAVWVTLSEAKHWEKQGETVIPSTEDALTKTLKDLGIIKGGPGSGHHGHEGRPGKVGGSQPSGDSPISVRQALRELKEVRELNTPEGYRFVERYFAEKADRNVDVGFGEIPEFRNEVSGETPDGFYVRAEDGPVLGLYFNEENPLKISIGGLFNSEPGSGLGTPMMEALWQYANITNKGIEVWAVANHEFFEKFNWLEYRGDQYFVMDRKKKGGPGSGHFGHEGRPGKVGGSQPSEGPTKPSGGYGENDEFYNEHGDRLSQGKGVAGVRSETQSLGQAYLKDGLPNQAEELMTGHERTKAILRDARNREFAKDELVKAIAEATGEDYGTVNERVKAWAGSASEAVLSQLHQEAAAEYFEGTSLSQWQELGHDDLRQAQIFLSDEDIGLSAGLVDHYGQILNTYNQLKGAESGDRRKELERLLEGQRKLVGNFGPIPDSLEDAARLQTLMIERATSPFEEAGYNVTMREVNELIRLKADIIKGSGISPDPASEQNQSFIGAVYDRTQKLMSDAGVKYITLYRGFHNAEFHPIAKALDAAGGDRVNVTLTNANALESWTTSLSTARAFTERGSMDSFILAMTVPVDRIWSTARTGPGCLSEEEFIIFSRDGDEAIAMEA